MVGIAGLTTLVGEKRGAGFGNTGTDALSALFTVLFSLSGKAHVLSRGLLPRGRGITESGAY